MDRSECSSRLLASAMHELRNALAVIRECVGLASDVARLQARGGEGARNIPKGMTARTVQDLDEVQRQVSRASEIADAVDFLGEASTSAGRSAQCDLARVASVFCVLARRRARAFHMELLAEASSEPVWCARDAMDVLLDLLAVFDICASAGGDVQVCFKAQRRKEGPGLLVSLGAGGETKEMVVSALAGSGSLMPDQGGWASRLVPWVSGDTKHFWLSLGAGQTA